MDAEKVMNVEMKELTPADVHDDKDAENDGMKGTAAKNEEEEEEVEEKEDHVYSKLKNPKEEIYCLAEIPTPVSTPKPNEDVYRRIRMYKWISALFTILSIVLLAVVFALAMKLSEVQSIQQCPETPEVKKSRNLNCTRQLCQSMYPQVQAAQNYEHLCPYCGRGWILFEKTCYFKSKERLSWQQSSEQCQKKGGHLAVIKNKDVQKFLTEIGGLLYWIGLRYVEKQQWTWIDNTIPTKSYWAKDQPNPDTQGGCAFLNGHTTEMSNWYSTPCEVVTQYICQKD